MATWAPSIPRPRAIETPGVDNGAANFPPVPTRPEPTEVDRSAKAAEAKSPEYLDRILVRKARRMVIVRTRDIQLIQASGNYVKIITADSSHLLRSPLSDLAQQLDPARFLRVHRSAVINTESLQAVETNPAGDYYLRLEGGRRLKCSRSYRSDLRTFLQGLS